MDKNRVVDKWILSADTLDNIADRRRIKSRLLGAVSCLPFLILLSSCSYMDIKRGSDTGRI